MAFRRLDWPITEVNFCHTNQSILVKQHRTL